VPSSQQEGHVVRNPISRLVSHIFGDRPGHVGVLVATAALAACGTVYSDGPVGNVPVELNPEQWNGVWAGSPEAAGPCPSRGQGTAGDDSGEGFVLTVVDAQEGVLNVASGDGTQHTAWLRTVRPAPADSPGDAEPGGPVAARRHQRQPYPMLVTLEDPDHAGTTRWQLTGWAALRGDVLLVWAADAMAFRELIAEGALLHDPSAPLTNSGDAHLGPLDEQALAVLTGERRWDLFEWDDPLVLYRVAAGSPACGNR
jgi:hypothetical protein